LVRASWASAFSSSKSISAASGSRLISARAASTVGAWLESCGSSASPDRTVVNGYPLLYETTYLRASRQRRRAQDPGGGFAYSTDAFTLRRSARYCSSATGARMPTRSLRSWAAMRKRRATPSMPSTRRGSRKHFGRVRSIRTPFTRPSMLGRQRLCARCFTITPLTVLRRERLLRPPPLVPRASARGAQPLPYYRGARQGG
jgi:hypothetical protein